MVALITVSVGELSSVASADFSQSVNIRCSLARASLTKHGMGQSKKNWTVSFLK